MPKIWKLIGRSGLPAAAGVSVLFVANASGGVYAPANRAWATFNQRDVLARFPVPAFSLPFNFYAQNTRDPNPDGFIADPTTVQTFGGEEFPFWVTDIPVGEPGFKDVEHPTLIYYVLLTEQMRQVELVAGNDDFNLLNYADSSDVATMIVGNGPDGIPGNDDDTMEDDELIGQPYLPTGGTINEDLDDATPEVPSCFTIGPGGLPNDGADGRPEEITACDSPADTDGIAESWPLSSFGIAPVLDLIEAPDPNDTMAQFDPDTEAELLATYQYYGLGTLKWTNNRPAFAHPDGEAIWRYSQQFVRDSVGEDAIGFGEPIPFAPLSEEPEGRQQFIDAFRAIEQVTNIRFVERDPMPEASNQGPFSPISSANGGIIVSGLDDLQVLSGDTEREPEDDFPFILFTGAPTRDLGFPTAVAGISLSAGSARGPLAASHRDLDYVLDDLDGDGFPDLLDNPFNGSIGAPSDGIPDVIFLSTLSDILGIGATGGPVAGTPGNAAGTIWDFANVIEILDPGGVTVGRIIPANANAPTFDFNGDGLNDRLLSVQGDIPLFQPTTLGVPLVSSANVQPDPATDPLFLMPNAMDVAELDNDGNPVLGDGLPDDIDRDGVLDVPWIAGPSVTFPTFAATQPGLGERHAIGQVYFTDQVPAVGTIIHETLHQLGYQHEMIREDRDNFVEIVFENVPVRLRSQFEIAFGTTILGTDINNDDLPDYDFESIMHYGRCGALPGQNCIDARATILVLPPFTAAFQDEIGTQQLSAGDAASLQSVYLNPQVPPDDPCIADLDGDNRINPADLSIYIDLYLGCPLGPVNADTPTDCRILLDERLGNFDGVIDTLDLINFFVLYQSGRGCSPTVIVPEPGIRNPIANNGFNIQ